MYMPFFLNCLCSLDGKSSLLFKTLILKWNILAELKQLIENILMCYKFFQIEVQITILGTSDTILLPF